MGDFLFYLENGILCTYQEYFSNTGRCEGDIMKAWLQLNKLPPPVGLKPGTARSAGQR